MEEQAVRTEAGAVAARESSIVVALCKVCSNNIDGDSRRWYCDDCRTEAKRASKRASQNRCKQQRAAYAKKQAELPHVKKQHVVASKKWRAASPTKVKEMKQREIQRQRENPELRKRANDSKKKSYKKNAEKVKAYQRVYQKVHRSEITARERIKYKNTDIGARKAVVGHLSYLGLSVAQVPPAYIEARIAALKIKRFVKEKLK